MFTGGDLTILVKSADRMRPQTRCWTPQPQEILVMISRSLTISTTNLSTGRTLHGTLRHRVVVHILAWHRDMVIVRVSPRHMQHSRPMATPPMSTQRVTFPLQARVFPTFHRSMFMIIHHPRPLRWPRFLLTITLTRRCIPTRTPPTHPNSPRVHQLRVRLGQIT